MSLSAVLRILLILLEVVLIFNLMIIVHEIGHFLAARWRGLVVEKFGIWFGKPLWKKVIGGVEYSLGSIPAGGFVALPQMAPMEVMEGKVDTPREALPPISALDKIIVAFAGPLFSVLLAVFFAVVVWALGRPVSESESTKTIGYVEPGSPAEKAGLLPGDLVQKVDGHQIKRFGGMTDSITWNVISSRGKSIVFDIQRAGQPLTITSNFEKENREFWERSGFRSVGIAPAETPRVAKVAKDSAAAQAGLQANDYVTEINGHKIYSPEYIDDLIGTSSSGAATFGVVRGGKTLQLPIQIDGPLVDKITANGPGAVAGIQPGDRIVQVNGQPVFTSYAVKKMIMANKEQVLSLTLQRRGKTLDVKLKPAYPDQPKNLKIPIIGVMWAPDSLAGITWDGLGRMDINHPEPWSQITAAAGTLFNTLGAVASHNSDVTLQHLSGPVGIMNVYYRLFQNEYGWQMALWFSVVLNINLAIMNMLPIPVLDGGHITLALIEAARRRPVNTKVLIWVQSACAYIIMGFLAYVTFFDIGDHFQGGKVKFDRPVPAVAQ